MNYNGWSNRSTWLVNLHLTNDEALYNDVMQMANDVVVETEDADQDTCVELLARELEVYVGNILILNDGAPLQGNSCEQILAKDLISDALDDVDWHEIASGFLELDKE